MACWRFHPNSAFHLILFLSVIAFSLSLSFFLPPSCYTPFVQPRVLYMILRPLPPAFKAGFQYFEYIHNTYLSSLSCTSSSCKYGVV